MEILTVYTVIIHTEQKTDLRNMKECLMIILLSCRNA